MTRKIDHFRINRKFNKIVECGFKLIICKRRTHAHTTEIKVAIISVNSGIIFCQIKSNAQCDQYNKFH